MIARDFFFFLGVNFCDFQGVTFIKIATFLCFIFKQHAIGK